MSWLSADITQDRTPEIREYLMSELSVEEVDPERITRRLTRDFLVEQPDCWIRTLYELLNGQRAIIRMLTGGSSRPPDLNIPLIRLTDGRHVPLGEPQAFLPGSGPTDFPTVRPLVCETTEARSFLENLGLREPDLVDDVLKNVVPKYQMQGQVVDGDEYERDITRILRAIASGSNTQRDKLVQQLSETPFVRSVGSGATEGSYATPQDIYLPTNELRQLFEGVDTVRFVDERYECLIGEQARVLLESCGATSYLKPVRDDNVLSSQEKYQLRRGDSSTRDEEINNWNLLGLDALLEELPSLSAEQRREKAGMLWQCLTELVHRGRHDCFRGTYKYHYYSWHSRAFSSQFVKQTPASPMPRCQAMEERTRAGSKISPSMALVFTTSEDRVSRCICSVRGMPRGRMRSKRFPWRWRTLPIWTARARSSQVRAGQSGRWCRYWCCMSARRVYIQDVSTQSAVLIPEGELCCSPFNRAGFTGA